MTQDLFGYSKSDREVTFENTRRVNGLLVQFDFINSSEEKLLIDFIDSSPWLNDLKRRVQHYGYKYDYKARRIDNSFYLGNLPNWMLFLIQRLNEQNIINFIPDQAIINEYTEGQGIAPHIDCEPCFGDTIISISINGPCVMTFQEHITGNAEKKLLLIPPRTLIVMKGDSRYKWYHGIPARKFDEFNGKKLKRNRRISITFRKVIL